MTDQQAIRNVEADLNAFFQEQYVHLFGREPRYRYFQTKDGREFHWTTEAMSDGKYASAIYVPKGKGARSGKKAVTRLHVTREVHHSTRKAAKARALRLYQEWRDHLDALP